MKRLLSNISNLLYKVHISINRLSIEPSAKSDFTPYYLNYTPSLSSAKIIHINGNFIIGGSSQLIVDIIERTSDIYNHKVVVPDYPDPLPYHPVSITKFSLGGMAGLYNFLREEKPALVHIHYWVREEAKYFEYAIWYQTVFKICEDLNLKVIQNINVPTEPYHSSAVVHNVFVSQFVLNNFNTASENATVIYPGSNFEHFSNRNLDNLPANSIGMVYRLDTDKLKPEAIEVFIAVVKKSPSTKCYIIGGGYYLDYYKRRVEEESMNSNFIFTGYVSYVDLPKYYKLFSLFVAPVYDESFGQVTPFAMSMGLCVAGYDTGALSEILGSKETLVESGEIDDLSNTIVDLLKDPKRLKSIGLKNQERALNKFSVETMINQYSLLYSKLI